jgi:hypothetical protein
MTATMTRTPARQQLAAAPKPEPVAVVLAPCSDDVLAPCSDEEYARRIAKSNEVKGYYVPGYLAA